MESSKKLLNNYFVYGTHPIRVSNHLSHSLSNGHIHNKESLPTTKSLGNFPQTNSNDDDDIFEDARSSFDDEKEQEEEQEEEDRIFPSGTSSEWIDAFYECDQINKLVFRNYMIQGLEKTTALQHRSLYHSLCHSTIYFIKAGLTFNEEDIQSTIDATRVTIQLAKKIDPGKSWISSFQFRSKNELDEYQLHAKLVYAEATLIRAFLAFTQDQGVLSFVHSGLKLKECNDVYQKLTKLNDRSRFASDISYEHFDSGVRMGNGLFNLLISHLPPRIISCLSFVGFSGDRTIGLTDLKQSAMSQGLRSTFSSMYLLTFYTLIVQIFGNADGDLDLCQQLVERNLQMYPNSYIFLYFKARLQTIHCHIEQAIKTYHFAIQCQSDWKSLHHISFWDLFWCHVLLGEWKEAAKLAEQLLAENNWSKSTYAYLLAICLLEENHGIADRRIQNLFRRVPELKIRLAGKSIPVEKYAIRQSEHFFAQEWLFLPALEFAYLMNSFRIFTHQPSRLKTTLDTVDYALKILVQQRQSDQFYADSYGSGVLLRGVLLHFLGQFDEALQSFDEILQMTKKFEHRSFIPVSACLEKGMVYLTLRQFDKAHEYFKRSQNDYKGYQLETQFQFRIDSSAQLLKKYKSENLK